MRTLAIALGMLVCLACGSDDTGEPFQPDLDGGADAGGGGAAASGAAGTSAGAGGRSGGAGAAGMAGRGAAGRAGGAAAAGSGNGGAGGAAGSDTCSGVFCEDFESGALDPATWTRIDAKGDNSASVQSAMVSHGRHALQLHAKGGSRYAMIFHEDLPAALEKHYFGRLYMYATAFPTDNGGHTAYVTSSNTLQGYPDNDRHLEIGSYTQSSGPIWQLTYWSGGIDQEQIGSGGKIPVAKWFCLQWELNDDPDSIQVQVDGDAKQGAKKTDIMSKGNPSNVIGGFTTLGLGFRTWHPEGAPDIDIYIDDVVLDTKKVDCLP